MKYLQNDNNVIGLKDAPLSNLPLSYNRCLYDSFMTGRVHEISMKICMDGSSFLQSLTWANQIKDRSASTGCSLPVAQVSRDVFSSATITYI